MFAIFLQEVVAKVAHMPVEAFVLSGSHALRPMPHNLSWGLASARRRGHSVHEGQAHFSFGRILPGCLGGLNFRILAARNRDRCGVHDGRGVFALGGHLKQGLLRAPYHRQIGGISRPS